MHLYSGSTTDFVGDATRNGIAEKLSGAFFHHFRYQRPKVRSDPGGTHSERWRMSCSWRGGHEGSANRTAHKGSSAVAGHRINPHLSRVLKSQADWRAGRFCPTDVDFSFQ